MHCASCAETVRKALASVPGVEACEVNFATNTARVDSSAKLPPELLESTVRDAGYGATVAESALKAMAASESEEQASSHRFPPFELVFAFVLAAIIMTLGMMHAQPLVQLALAIPVQFWAGRSFIKGALRSVVTLSPNMDTLVAMGTLPLWL